MAAGKRAFDEQENSDVSEASVSVFVLLGGFITVMYLAICIGHLFLVKCGLKSLKAMELNALGDYLAGTFAPLAFLWLVVAVFVQKEELRAQLKEFRESNSKLAAQYDLQARSIEKTSIGGKFPLISRECITLAKILGIELDEIESLHRKDLHPEAIAAFTEGLGAYIDLNGGMDEWMSLPYAMASQRDRMLHHLSVVSDAIQQLRDWLKGREDDELRSQIADAEMYRLERFVFTLQLHLTDEEASH